MSVKILLMWNSKLLIDWGGDEIVATSLLEASNLLVLKVFVVPAPACLHVFRYFFLNFVIYCAWLWVLTFLFDIRSQESSVIHSESYLGIHGQGLLNLSGRGDLIEAQRLILSLFYGINVRWRFNLYSFGMSSIISIKFFPH